MAFLFKSKKNQDRSLQSRDGPNSGAQSASGRMARDEKHGTRGTPNGSLNSFDGTPSPDVEKFNTTRRAPEQAYQAPSQQPQQQMSDLPVSFATPLVLFSCDSD
jgi:hypothetical protein